VSNRSWQAVCLLAALAAPWVWGPAPPAAAVESSANAFTLVDGDQVVLLGSTLIEREQSQGYLEAALTSRFYPAHIQFRNLGWSGDNVWGEARARFGTVADGFNHLKEHIATLKPTVILLNYGANESFAGPAGLDHFLSGLDTLLKTLDESQARIVFLLSPRQEDLGRPLPDPRQHNQDLKLYNDAIARVAAERHAPVVNLYELMGPKLTPPAGGPLTDNGLHWTAYGYWRAAPVIEQGLGLPARRWQVEVDAPRQNIAASGVQVRQARFKPGQIQFSAQDQWLPLPPAPADAPPAGLSAAPTRVVRVFGLPGGSYALSIGDQQVAVASAAQWAAGMAIEAGPDLAQAEQLRQRILVKNQLYFHRWRPQNETYLLGFRKHEQGQNAIEIPQFDPLVAAEEQQIHALSAPREHAYSLVKVDTK